MVNDPQLVIGENGFPLQHREGSRRTVNARRAGKTHSDRVEFLLDDDTRHPKYAEFKRAGLMVRGSDSAWEFAADNRAQRRARGHRSSYKRSPHKRSVKAAPKPKREKNDRHS